MASDAVFKEVCGGEEREEQSAFSGTTKDECAEDGSAGEHVGVNVAASSLGKHVGELGDADEGVDSSDAGGPKRVERPGQGGRGELGGGLATKSGDEEKGPSRDRKGEAAVESGGDGLDAAAFERPVNRTRGRAHGRGRMAGM